MDRALDILRLFEVGIVICEPDELVKKFPTYCGRLLLSFTIAFTLRVPSAFAPESIAAREFEVDVELYENEFAMVYPVEAFVIESQ